MTLDPLDSLTESDLRELTAIEDEYGPKNGIFAAGGLCDLRKAIAMTDQPTTEYWPAEIEPEPQDTRRDRNAAAVLLLREGWELDEVDQVLKEVSDRTTLPSSNQP